MHSHHPAPSYSPLHTKLWTWVSHHFESHCNKSRVRCELAAFKHFLRRHSISFTNSSQFHARLAIFRENLKKIEALNHLERGTAKYAITKFAHLTEDEFKVRLGFRPSLRRPEGRPSVLTAVLNGSRPDSFDWRIHGAVTPVKNQGHCGSCWAFSTTGNVEGQWFLKHGKLISLSEQELVDCDKKDDGCNGGLPENAYEAIKELGGLETEEAYPYDGKDDACHSDAKKAVVQVNGSLELPKDEEQLAQWLSSNGPISIGINANTLQFYWGGVSHPPRILCNPESLDHGVLIVGYGVHVTKYLHRVQPYWTVKNSWGEDWGEKGYFRVYRGDGTCGVNQMATSSIVP